MSEFNTDFNLEDDFTPEPLVPQGTYRANVTAVSHNPEKYCILWQLTLSGNDGVCSDGETPVDGQTVFFNNWLPKPGDGIEMTAKGSMTKRQSKINQLKKFADTMDLADQFRTPAAISEFLTSAEGVGIEVLIDIKIREYEGNFSNEVSKMRLA
jgi:hypothetical protein